MCVCVRENTRQKKFTKSHAKMIGDSEEVKGSHIVIKETFG